MFEEGNNKQQLEEVAGKAKSSKLQKLHSAEILLITLMVGAVVGYSTRLHNEILVIHQHSRTKKDCEKPSMIDGELCYLKLSYKGDFPSTNANSISTRVLLRSSSELTQTSS
jgi:hypothetical protein